MRLSTRAAMVLGRDLTLGVMAERLAAVHGDRALVEEAGGGPITYRQASDRVDAMAVGIGHAGARAGDRVVVAIPNGYDQYLLCLAVARAGAIAVPVNPQMSTDEIDYVVSDSGARVVVRAAAEVLTPGAPLIRLSIEADPADVAAIFYTSGTTGRPKGARLTHQALVGVPSTAAMWPNRLRRDEAVVALPVAHIMGFGVITSLACAGVPTYWLARFNARAVLDAIEHRRSTIFVGVPAMYRLLLEAGAQQRDLRSVRMWVSGADVMPAGLARRFQTMGATVTLPVLRASIGDAAFVEGYGMVETGGGVAAKVSPPGFHLPAGLPRPFGTTLGLPIPPNRLRVVGQRGRDVGLGEVGELWIKGPSVLEGYHGDDAATAAVRTPDGWLRTGDLVRRGLFGIVGFVGRAKDVIKSGGYSVYATEVERALEQHPDVVEAAVVGLPDERLGEVPVAVVRVRDSAAIGEHELQEWARERLASYKAPRAVRIVDELPRTGTDKVAKRRLLAFFAA